MIHAVEAVIIGLVAYWIIGLGPSLALARGPHRRSMAAAMAGPMGLALTALAGMVLVGFDLPVEKWAWPWVIFMVVASFVWILCRRAVLVEPLDRGERGFLLLLGLTTLTALLLALAPVVIGGIEYMALRFNRWDALNYLSMARYLRTRPLSWIIHADKASLIARDALYLHTSDLFRFRYCTSMLMAWIAVLGGIPTAQIEYSQGIIYLLLAIGPMLALGRLAGLSWWANFLLGLAISVGFWGLLVIDLRAESQLNSIPLLCWIALAAAMLEEPVPLGVPGVAGSTGRTFVRWQSILVLTLGIAALAPVYAEILPMTLGGLGLFVVVRACQTRSLWTLVPWVSVAVFAALLLGWASWPPFSRFLLGQIRSAAGGDVNWDLAYFPWLYKNPWRDLLVGPWGLSYFAAQGEVPWSHPSIGDSLLLLAAAALTAIYIGWLVTSCWAAKNRPAVMIVHAMALLAFAQFFLLLWRGHLWAAGKGMSFGYMFILAGLVFALPALHGSGGPNRRSTAWAQGGAIVLIGAWLIVQGLVVPLYRINLVRHGQEPPNYLWIGRLYMRRYDYDTRPFEAALTAKPGASLGIAIDNIWLTHFMALTLGDNRPIIDFYGIRDRDQDELHRVVLGRQSLAPPPEFLLIEQRSPILGRLHGAEKIAENKNFILMRRTQETWGTGLVLWPNSPGVPVSGGPGKPRFLVGRDPLVLNLVNLDDHIRPITLEADMAPGTGLSDPTMLAVIVDADSREKTTIVSELTQWKLQVPLQAYPGVQTIRVALATRDPAAQAWVTALRLVTPSTAEK